MCTLDLIVPSMHTSRKRLMTWTFSQCLLPEERSPRGPSCGSGPGQVHQEARRLAAPAVAALLLLLPDPLELGIGATAAALVLSVIHFDEELALVADLPGMPPQSVLLPLRHPTLDQHVFRVLLGVGFVSAQPYGNRRRNIETALMCSPDRSQSQCDGPSESQRTGASCSCACTWGGPAHCQPQVAWAGPSKGSSDPS